jgi:uncharacterized protein (TIGR00369 family)
MSDPSDPQTALDVLLAGGRPAAQALATIGYRFVGRDAATGEVEVSFVATDAFTNLAGNVQGGFLAAMLDAAVSTALMATMEPGQLAPTLELNVSYLRPARVGPLLGRGRVVHRGGSVGFLAGELHDPDGACVATASATVKIVRAPRP